MCKKLLFTLFLLLGLLLTISLRAPSFVNDFTHTLLSRQSSVLNKQLHLLDQKEGIQLVVVIVSSLDGKPISDVAEHYMALWQVGHHGKDSGILLLISKKEMASYIALGYGLEGRIEEPMALKITQEVIDPLLKKGDLNRAVDVGVEAIFSSLGVAFDEEGLHDLNAWWNTTSLILFLISLPLLFMVARMATSRHWWFSPLIGFVTGITQSLGLAIVLAALGATMVAICNLLRYTFKH